MDNVSDNWGRWGDSDERGLANLLQGNQVVRACGFVRTGTVYELGISVRKSAPVVGGRLPPLHLMSVDGGDYAALGRNDGQGSADDYIMLATHGTSHIDALSHIWHNGQMFNGYSSDTVRSSGAAKNAIDKTGGLVTVGHLLDVRPERLGSHAVGPDDLDRLIAEAGAEIRPGDALLLRTGWMERRDSGADAAALSECPGLAPDCGPWLREHDISMVGADNEGVERLDRKPLELHKQFIRDFGGYLLELLQLAPAGDGGAVSGLLVVAPLRIHRGVGSPINPLLIV